MGENTYPITLEKGFEIRVDTTFSNPTELYFSYEDTVYSVGLRNPESGGTDTLFVNSRNVSTYQTDEHFQKIFSKDVVTRSELRTDYLRKKYHLDNSLLTCPVTQEPYVFEIDSTDNEVVFQVTSPLHLLDKPYTESRFVVFTFEAGDHGYIRGSMTSWAK